MGVGPSSRTFRTHVTIKPTKQVPRESSTYQPLNFDQHNTNTNRQSLNVGLDPNSKTFCIQVTIQPIEKVTWETFTHLPIKWTYVMHIRTNLGSMQGQVQAVELTTQLIIQPIKHVTHLPLK